MKRIGLALMIVVLFAGCAFAVEQLMMATGGTAGTYFPLGGAMGQVMSEKSGVASITVQSTGASGENLTFLGDGEVDLALVQNDMAHYAYNGLEVFKDFKISNIRTIARLYPEYVHVVAQGESNINGIADFKGHSISVGVGGGGNEANARQVFEFYNLSYNNFKPLFISYAETTSHFKDRHIDAFIYTVGIPNPSIMDIVTLHNVSFLPIDGSQRDELIKNYPFFAPAVIPANTYRGQAEDIETVSLQAVMVVREDVPENIVYAITKALFENLDAVASAHAKGYEISAEKALEGVTVPLHAGAERYFKEIGVIR